MPDPETNPNPKPEAEPKDDTSEAEKWKALARKHEAQAKANADAARKLAALEEAGKTEAQKAADTAAEDKAARVAAEARADRLEVAMAKGLTPGQAKRLQGATRAELEADADDLLESFPAAEPPRPPPNGKPTERLSGGGDPTLPLNGDPLEQALRQKLGIT